MVRWGALDLVRRVARNQAARSLTAVTYHRIAKDQDAGAEVDDLFDVTLAGFEEHIAALAEEFQFITATDLVRWRRGGKLPPRPVLVTFDDGYLDCYTRALPVLTRHRAQATFFVSPRHLDERRLFWWERLGRLIARARVAAIEIAYPTRLRLSLEPSPVLALQRLLTLVKMWQGLDLERFLAELSDQVGVPLALDGERDEVDEVLMTWEHVRELAAAGMDVASHTDEHRVLGTLAPSALLSDLLRSRLRLEEQLGRGVESLAYPVGYPVGHVEHLRRLLLLSGYQVGFTNHSGASRLGPGFDPFDVRRIAMARDYRASDLLAFAHWPALAPRRRFGASAWSRGASHSDTGA